MKSGFDAIVVGAGPAGCAAAYDLAAHGRQVLLLDKCEFPRLKPCAGALTIKTLNALRFDAAPVIRRVCREMKLSLGEAGKILTNDRPIAVMTVREEFDQFCLNQCAARGADFRAAHRLTALARDGEDWIVSTNHGTFRGRFLIGADGANSQVRKLLSRTNPLRFGLALETCVAVDRPGDWPMEFDFAAVDRGYGWVFPKDDHLNVGLYSLNPTIPHAAQKLAAFVAAKTGRTISRPIHGHRIPHDGRRARFAWSNACLIGDAAGLIDPLLGEGIYNAIRSGQLAARAIIHGNGSGRTDFAGEIDEVRRDLASYDSDTRRFYSNIRRGYRRLMRFPVSRVLINGFSLGLPIIRIKRRTLALLFPQSARRNDNWSA
ncbi:MAG: geranylgeranyl reductase family protein [Tepidisphaeraceae bacterium]